MYLQNGKEGDICVIQKGRYKVADFINLNDKHFYNKIPYIAIEKG
jgi:hypothetical protein